MVENIEKSDRVKNFIHTRIVIDTSVLIKAFVDEENSEFVRSLIRLHESKQLTLISTPLLLFEFLNVLANVFREQTKVELALREFFRIEIGLISPRYGYLEKGIGPACVSSQISFYDSSYHALAKDMDGIFLTADKKYYEIMKEDGHIAFL